MPSDYLAAERTFLAWIRPNRLFTADEGIIVYCAGRVSAAKLNEVVDRLIAIISRS